MLSQSEGRGFNPNRPYQTQVLQPFHLSNPTYEARKTTFAPTLCKVSVKCPCSHPIEAAKNPAAHHLNLHIPIQLFPKMAFAIFAWQGNPAPLSKLPLDVI